VAIRVAFYTGLRLGEIRRVQVDGRALHLADTKNGDRRSLPALQHATASPVQGQHVSLLNGGKRRIARFGRSA
jgi:hypothetical protein